MRIIAILWHTTAHLLLLTHSAADSLLLLLSTDHGLITCGHLQMMRIYAPFMLLLLCMNVNHVPGTILYGAHSGRQVKIPRITCVISTNQSHLPFAIMRRQFPVIPAYAYTVHRSQGQSLDLLGIYFNGEPFCHGLLFTAVSRVRGDWSCITVHAPPASSYHLTDCVKHHVLQCLQE